MDIPISEADFQVLYDAMFLANHPYDHEGAVEVVRLERRAWLILERLAQEHGLTHTADQPG